MDLRKYQQLVLDQALDGNRIAVLPTGSGKTLIACHVIEYRIKLVRKQRGDCEWGKVVVYIAPTKVLLNQQIPYIQTHTPCNLQAIALDGDTYYNALKIEFWGEKEWMYYFRRYEVFGMTPEVFRQLLDKRIIPPSTIDAVIIDECHHARGAHPMALMAKAIIRTQDNVFLFSMTASPFNRKKGDKNKMLHELQQNLNSSFIVINMDMKSSIDMHRASPCLWVAKLETNPSCDRSISTLLRHALVFERIYFTPSCHSLPQYKVFFPNPRVFSSVERLQVFEEAVHRIIVTADALGGYGGLCALRLWLDDHMTWSSAGNSCLSARVFSNEDAAVVETIVAELEEEDSTYRNGLCNQQNCIVTAFMKLAAYLVDLNRHELINGQLRTTQGELPSVNQMIITAIDNGGVCPPMLLVTPLNTFFRALCQVITSLCDKLSTEFSLQVDPHRVNNVSLLSPKLRWLFHCLQQYLVNPQGDESIFSSIGAICIQKQLERRTATDHPSNGKPAVVIVFCKMRLVVATLFHLAMLIQKSKSPYVKALMLKGDTSKREQQRIMRELRKGPANVLFATDVVEEGVDLAACNLVIHFDPIDNLKSFIQRKGRARRLSAHCIHIIHDEKSLQDIHGFIEEEENWKLALSTILHAPSNPDQYFEVPATKARIYGSSAVGLVNEYCRMMFLNRHSIHSIYHRHPVPKDDSSNTSELFQCDLRVPMLQVHENGQEPNIVYHSFCSDIHPSKRAAKEQVALQAVERLHQMGVLDDHLRLTSRRQRKHEPVGQNLPRESAESLRSVFKNSVPDLLRLPPDVKPIRTVYLHSLRVIPMHEMQEQPSSGLSHNIAALESICIGLLQPLPSSALAMKSTILLRDGVANVLCEMQWEVLGSLEVTERPHGSDFLPLARRYHEAIACIQLPLNFLPPRDFLPIPLSQDTPVSNQSLDFNWQDWVSSSNNTWYILLPRFPALLSEVHPGAWLSWLRESTLKAEALIHNLFVIHHNSTAEAESFFPNTTLAACNASDDVLITSNGRNLLHYMGEYSEYGLNSTMPRSQKTFYAHYAQRPGHYRRVLDNLASIPDYKLCMAHPVSTKLTWIDILMSSDVAGEKHESKAVEVIPDLCQVLGSMQQFRVMMLFPSVALHLNAVAMAADCQVWLSQQMQGDSGTLPSVELILRAITPKLLQENISSER